MSAVHRSAILSDEAPPVYRSDLTRTWDDALPVMVWVMLNPSTADHEIDDPTILACMDFARRNGCGGIVVVNLFAVRSPHPKVMKAHAAPIGPSNDAFLQRHFVDAAADGGLVIAAWGTGGDHLGRAAEVRAMVEKWGLTLHCFGVTKDGHPKHPLARGHHRIDRDTKPMPWPAL
jgi:hypothetical protein